MPREQPKPSAEKSAEKKSVVPKSTKTPEELNAAYILSVEKSVSRIKQSSGRLSRKMRSRKYSLSDSQKAKVKKAIEDAAIEVIESMEPRIAGKPVGFKLD